MNKFAVSFVVPAYNEEASIAEVIDTLSGEIKANKELQAEIIIIDDGSADNTAAIAIGRGAKVIRHEKNKGKGAAINTAFKNLHPESRYVIMLDADNTYLGHEAGRLLEPLTSNLCDVIIGSRLGGRMSEDSMTRMNRIGNWLFTFLIRVIYKANITDSCSGYVAWKREVVEELSQCDLSSGFSIEVEMIAKAQKLGYTIYSVPITYQKRTGRGSTLKPVSDGIKIIAAIFQNMYWKPPKNKLHKAAAKRLESLVPSSDQA
jgi:glycosyltransferase involved in cell wall biosynthesis